MVMLGGIVEASSPPALILLSQAGAVKGVREIPRERERGEGGERILAREVESTRFSDSQPSHDYSRT